MSLRDRISGAAISSGATLMRKRFGVAANPFPSSSQNASNPHLPTPLDLVAEDYVVSFVRDQKSQVVLVEGVQGVGKTNFLNNFETELRGALSEQGYYVVRYFADPEGSFDGTICRIFQDLGVSHVVDLSIKLEKDEKAIGSAKMVDMRHALGALRECGADDIDSYASLFLEWLLGARLLKAHRESLGVQFRLDTVESKTAALRDLVVVSHRVGLLAGVFLLLDELEKQGGVLSPILVVRYLSALRAIIDALPEHLFMMIAVTPDAMRRYAVALPAFRSRLENKISLKSLTSLVQARKLANFYVDYARTEAKIALPKGKVAYDDPASEEEVEKIFNELTSAAGQRADVGVRQREFLHRLHALFEAKLKK